jgi:hypothetical protein
LNNWESYNTQDNKRTTNEQQTNNKRTTTTNKNNKEYKENNEYTTDTLPTVIEQALVLENTDIILDKRNVGTQRIVDIIKDQVKQEGFLYDNNSEERRRATIIAKRQADW